MEVDEANASQLPAGEEEESASSEVDDDDDEEVEDEEDEEEEEQPGSKMDTDADANTKQELEKLAESFGASEMETEAAENANQDLETVAESSGGSKMVTEADANAKQDLEKLVESFGAPEMDTEADANEKQDLEAPADSSGGSKTQTEVDANAKQDLDKPAGLSTEVVADGQEQPGEAVASTEIVPFGQAAVDAKKKQELTHYTGGHELSEILHEDGRLLRMFVSRKHHHRPDAKECATRDWLIMPDFYDKWIETFKLRYSGDPKEKAEEEAVEGDEKGAEEQQQQDIVENFGSIFKKLPEVDKLEQKVQVCNGDIYALRDALLEAVKDLMSPRRWKSTNGMTGSKMTPEAIEGLKLQRQLRLREVVFNCLHGIWRNKMGGEVLRVAVDHVQKLINKFEYRDDDVRVALGGGSWHKLKGLLVDITGELPDDAESGKKVAHEGKGTKRLIAQALEALGGSASTYEIFEWIDANPDKVEEDTGIILNVKERKTKGQTHKVWHGTVRCALTRHFHKSAVPVNGSYVWFAEKPDSEMPAIEGQAKIALEDVPAGSAAVAVAEAAPEQALVESRAVAPKRATPKARGKGKAKAKAKAKARDGQEAAAAAAAADGEELTPAPKKRRRKPPAAPASDPLIT